MTHVVKTLLVTLGHLLPSAENLKKYKFTKDESNVCTWTDSHPQTSYRLRLVMGVSSSKTHCRLGGGWAENWQWNMASSFLATTTS